MAEATSALNFRKLIAEVAYKLGIASYGSSGVGEPEIPTDPHDLFICKRTVNNAIRMFINDAPMPNGWRWLRPVASVTIWPGDRFQGTILTAALAGGQTTITVTPNVFDSSMEGQTVQINGSDFVIAEFIAPGSVILTGDASAFVGFQFVIAQPSGVNTVATATFSGTLGTTVLTVSAATFYPTMELKTIVIAGISFTIDGYVSPTVLTVVGDASARVGDTFSIHADGAYTLPLGFGGQVDGHATYEAGTNRGASLQWVDESIIRERQSNVGEETGTPFRLATRIKDTGTPRRRWELVVDRTPSEVFVILFPYTIHFNLLEALTDVPPAPIGHDEAIRAASLAVAERDVEDSIGSAMQYYRSALINSYRVDSKSAPRSLGYFGNGGRSWPGIQDWRDSWYQRPTVDVNL